MINEEMAREIAKEFIESLPFESLSEDKLVIIDEYTVKKPYGWIFSYNTHKFLETQDYGDALVNNSPIIVNKQTGSVEEIPGGPLYRKNLEEYEKRIQSQ
jgi:Immunity protein 35